MNVSHSANGNTFTYINVINCPESTSQMWSFCFAHWYTLRSPVERALAHHNIEQLCFAGCALTIINNLKHTHTYTHNTVFLNPSHHQRLACSSPPTSHLQLTNTWCHRRHRSHRDRPRGSSDGSNNLRATLKPRVVCNSSGATTRGQPSTRQWVVNHAFKFGRGSFSPGESEKGGQQLLQLLLLPRD